ncbi:hypothetical protein CHE218_25720 [Microbacterium sp. che218]
MSHAAVSIPVTARPPGPLAAGAAEEVVDGEADADGLGEAVADAEADGDGVGEGVGAAAMTRGTDATVTAVVTSPPDETRRTDVTPTAEEPAATARNGTDASVRSPVLSSPGEVPRRVCETVTVSASVTAEVKPPAGPVGSSPVGTKRAGSKAISRS